MLFSAGAKIGLIDYGQSKQLPLRSKLAFAQLIHDLDDGNEENILTALQGLGVQLQAGSPSLASKMAYGMFDTRGRSVSWQLLQVVEDGTGSTPAK